MKIFLTAITLCSVLLPTIQASAQTEPSPGKVALIDMAYVFNNYERFKDARSTLQEQASISQQQFQQQVDELKSRQAKLQQFEQSSNEYKALEQESLSLAVQLQTQQQVVKRNLTREESKLYKEIYLEIEEATKKYAEYYKCTLVLRFSRNSVADAENPQSIQQSMVRQVIYHRNEDDISDAIVEYLNRNYRKTKPKAAAE